MRYRKKPIVIEAIQFWNGDGPNTIKACKVFCEGKAEFNNDDHLLYISTLEGVMKANDGDWIIRGIEGEYYPCEIDIFAQTYEEVTESADK